MDYKAVHILCDEGTSETLSVLLQEANFEGSAFENGKLIAYCKPDLFNAKEVNEILTRFELIPEQITDIKNENWNQLWENNFKESNIGSNIHVRAPFQESKNVKHDIIILPKMAFGTGHHETTQLTALALEKLDCKNKSVLDMGCGSGLIAILASQKGAKKIIAIDYDQNAVENAKENMQLNSITNVEVQQASSVQHLTEKYDIVASNIVKNINLRLLPEFVEILNVGGHLVLCGFLEEDLHQLTEAASAHNLTLIERNTDNGWLQTKFIKQNG